MRYPATPGFDNADTQVGESLEDAALEEGGEGHLAVLVVHDVEPPVVGVEPALVKVTAGMLGGVADMDAYRQFEILAGFPEGVVAPVAVGNVVDGGGEDINAPGPEICGPFHFDHGIFDAV